MRSNFSNTIKITLTHGKSGASCIGFYSTNRSVIGCLATQTVHLLQLCEKSYYRRIQFHRINSHQFKNITISPSLSRGDCGGLIHREVGKLVIFLTYGINSHYNACKNFFYSHKSQLLGLSNEKLRTLLFLNFGKNLVCVDVIFSKYWFSFKAIINVKILCCNPF